MRVARAAVVAGHGDAVPSLLVTLLKRSSRRSVGVLLELWGATAVPGRVSTRRALRAEPREPGSYAVITIASTNGTRRTHA
jgi:hypothetical protein